MHTHLLTKATLYFTSILLICFSCQDKKQSPSRTKNAQPKASVELMVLGIAQDAGYPQTACRKTCCAGLWDKPDARRMVSCLGLVDHANEKTYLFDATPDFKFQIENLTTRLQHANKKLPDAIFLTHAHIGHYTGLMHLGREAVGAEQVPVYAMPVMKKFLETNGPWSQLVSLKNIDLKALQKDSVINLPGQIAVTPFQVPHRDEFSETVGYKIETPEKKYLFIPDIDKWQKWDRDIRAVLKGVDLAFLDGSFYQNGEIPGRDMSLIPHPFIEESMQLFEDLPETEKSKVHFIHFNHTNPVLKKDAPEYNMVLARGFKIAEEGVVY